MVEVGYAMASEERPPLAMVRDAARAEEAGFATAWVSDHYHPWIGEQGQSPFVWSVLGGIAAVTERMRVGTGVTCPTVRIHPAVVAQAAATSAVMFEGRFFLGVGSGEALNEHILGDRWPPADVRLDMLAEAVEVMRALWDGRSHTHRGRHYTVENARLYTVPEQPPPVMVSAFGPEAITLAARIGDGYVGTSPEPELVEQFRKQGGEGKRTLAGAKVCYGPDAAEARRTVHRLWPHMGLPGQLAQDLPTVAHFEQAVSIVTEDMAVGPVPCGPDPEPYIASLRAYADAGYDEVYVQQVGPDQDRFFDFFEREVLPEFR